MGILSKDAKFRQAVLEATASALRVRAEDDDDHDWIDLLSMHHAACCIRVELRLHSAADAPDSWPPPKPRHMEFERLFLRSLQERIRFLRNSSEGGTTSTGMPENTNALVA